VFLWASVVGLRNVLLAYPLKLLHSVSLGQGPQYQEHVGGQMSGSLPDVFHHHALVHDDRLFGPLPSMPGVLGHAAMPAEAIILWPQTVL